MTRPLFLKTILLGWEFSVDEKDNIRIAAPDGVQVLSLPREDWNFVADLLSRSPKDLVVAQRAAEDDAMKLGIVAAFKRK